MNDLETTKPKVDFRAAGAAYGSALGVVMCILMFFLSFPDRALDRLPGPIFANGVFCHCRLAHAAAFVSGNRMWRANLFGHSRIGSGKWTCSGSCRLDLPLAMAAAAAIVPLCIFAEWLWHRDRWEALKTAMEDCTVTDMLLFRHIPNLRERPTAAEHSGGSTT